MKDNCKFTLEKILINFNHLEYNPEIDRLLIVVLRGEKIAQKIPIFRLSCIYTKDNKIIVEDDGKSAFFMEISGEQEKLKKLQELKDLIDKHKNCKSNFLP